MFIKKFFIPLLLSGKNQHAEIDIDSAYVPCKGNCKEKKSPWRFFCIPFHSPENSLDVKFSSKTSWIFHSQYYELHMVSILVSIPQFIQNIFFFHNDNSTQSRLFQPNWRHSLHNIQVTASTWFHGNHFVKMLRKMFFLGVLLRVFGWILCRPGH